MLAPRRGALLALVALLFVLAMVLLPCPSMAQGGGEADGAAELARVEEEKHLQPQPKGRGSSGGKLLQMQQAAAAKDSTEGEASEPAASPTTKPVRTRIPIKGEPEAALPSASELETPAAAAAAEEKPKAASKPTTVENEEEAKSEPAKAKAKAASEPAADEEAEVEAKPAPTKAKTAPKDDTAATEPVKPKVASKPAAENDEESEPVKAKATPKDNDTADEKETEVIAEKAPAAKKGKQPSAPVEQESEETEAASTDDVKNAPAKSAAPAAADSAESSKNEEEEKESAPEPKGKGKAPTSPSSKNEDEDADASEEEADGVNEETQPRSPISSDMAKSCPQDCSGNGQCILPKGRKNPICVCDDGWEDRDCSQSTANSSEHSPSLLGTLLVLLLVVVCVERSVWMYRKRGCFGLFGNSVRDREGFSQIRQHAGMDDEFQHEPFGLSDEPFADEPTNARL